MLRNLATLSAYAKFSPISNGLMLLSLQNYEIATGAIYTFPTTKSLAFLVSVDYSLLNLSISDSLGLLSAIQSSTFTVSAGVSY